MRHSKGDTTLVSGIGLTTSIGQGKENILPRLYDGDHNFSVMKRKGRQLPQSAQNPSIPLFLGAEIENLVMPPSIPEHLTRNISLSAQVALCTLDEAWRDAGLEEINPTRIGLVVGGNNVQQREITLAHERYHGKENFIRPAYAMSFMDTDIAGICCEGFGIKGLSNTIGGASASGQLAVIHALKAVRSGEVDVCIALGALMDLSYWEFQSLRSLGAMGSDRYAQSPEFASRPFDTHRDGFIYGESCAAVVVENTSATGRSFEGRNVKISGFGVFNDANRNPNPSVEGEVSAIRLALEEASLSPRDIDYVSPHGTGSTIGDETELAALGQCELNNASINSSKSIVGHGLTAAGAVEIALTALQMKQGRLHPSRNLDSPINPDFNWVREKPRTQSIEHSLSMSMGFGGINSAVCLSMC